MGRMVVKRLTHIVYLTNSITYLKLYGENPPKTGCKITLEEKLEEKSPKMM
jgi:hypothetical protein